MRPQCGQPAHHGSPPRSVADRRAAQWGVGALRTGDLAGRLGRVVAGVRLADAVRDGLPVVAAPQDAHLGVPFGLAEHSRVGFAVAQERALRRDAPPEGGRGAGGSAKRNLGGSRTAGRTRQVEGQHGSEVRDGVALPRRLEDHDAAFRQTRLAVDRAGRAQGARQVVGGVHTPAMLRRLGDDAVL